jgi:hypothetical protein
MAEGPIDLALEVAAVLDRLGISYVLGGSLASSLVGEPRATVDIDLAIRLGAADVDRLLAELGAAFYVSEEAALAAVRRHASFNAVHLASVQKVDFFVLGDGLLDRRQLERRRRVVLVEEPRQELWVTSDEDQVLRKLDWFRAGAGVSDRQWRDVVGILAVQAEHIDRADLEAAAAELGLDELLARAFLDAESFGTRD